MKPRMMKSTLAILCPVLLVYVAFLFCNVSAFNFGLQMARKAVVKGLVANVALTAEEEEVQVKAKKPRKKKETLDPSVLDAVSLVNSNQTAAEQVKVKKPRKKNNADILDGVSLVNGNQTVAKSKDKKNKTVAVKKKKLTPKEATGLRFTDPKGAMHDVPFVKEHMWYRVLVHKGAERFFIEEVKRLVLDNPTHILHGILVDAFVPTKEGTSRAMDGARSTVHSISPTLVYVKTRMNPRIAKAIEALPKVQGVLRNTHEYVAPLPEGEVATLEEQMTKEKQRGEITKEGKELKLQGYVEVIDGEYKGRWGVMTGTVHDKAVVLIQADKGDFLASILKMNLRPLDRPLDGPIVEELSPEEAVGEMMKKGAGFTSAVRNLKSKGMLEEILYSEEKAEFDRERERERAKSKGNKVERAPRLVLEEQGSTGFGDWRGWGHSVRQKVVREEMKKEEERPVRAKRSRKEVEEGEKGGWGEVAALPPKREKEERDEDFEKLLEEMLRESEAPPPSLSRSAPVSAEGGFFLDELAREGAGEEVGVGRAGGGGERDFQEQWGREKEEMVEKSPMKERGRQKEGRRVDRREEKVLGGGDGEEGVGIDFLSSFSSFDDFLASLGSPTRVAKKKENDASSPIPSSSSPRPRSSPATSPSPALSSLSKAELQERLKEKGLPISGTKEALIERLGGKA